MVAVINPIRAIIMSHTRFKFLSTESILTSMDSYVRFSDAVISVLTSSLEQSTVSCQDLHLSTHPQRAMQLKKHD